MRFRAHPHRPSCIVAVVGAISTLGLLWGCSEPTFYVRTKPELENSPSRAYLVVVTREPPPYGALLVGELAFFKHFDELPAALASIRDRARRMGGDLVASLRCQPEKRFLETRRFALSRSEPLAPGDRLHCYAKVYWVP